MIFLYIVIVGIIFVAMISCIDINRLSVKKYEIETSLIKRDITIAFLSDMHNKEHGRDNYKLIDAVRRANPDLILVGGDMLIARPGAEYNKPLELMKYLKDYPIYYGIGNHEYRMKLYRDDYGEGFEAYVAALKECGVNVLQNDSVKLDDWNIEIQGLMIGKEYYKRNKRVVMEDSYLNELIGPLDKNIYRILLAHNPEYFDCYKKFANLTLSGHVHGGIMRLPVLGGVISPRMKLFPRYDGGRFDDDESTMVISRGLGSHTLPIRVFNPAELDIICLKCKK